MGKRIAGILFTCGLMLSTLVGCAGSAASASSATEQVESSAGAGTIVAATAVASATENAGDHEDADDCAWQETGVVAITLNGTTIAADGDGADGLELNGSVVMTGGVLIVNGPTEQMNGALDYDGSFAIIGGVLVAVGSAGMAQAPDASSTQASLWVNLSASQPAGTLAHIETSQGEALLTFVPAKAYPSVVFSSPDLDEGETVDLYLVGSSTGAASAGLIEGGAYAPGAKAVSLTLSGTVTRVGNRAR